MREIKIDVAIKFYKRKNKLFQHFIFLTNKRNLNYLNDIQLDINDELENLILSNKLDNFTFLERIDKFNEIVLVYESNNEDFVKPKNYYRTLFSLLPDFKGCNFCRYKEPVQGLFFECKVYSKVFTKNKKRCKMFKQKKEIKT